MPSVVTTSGDLPELVTHGDDGWVCPRDHRGGAGRWSRVLPDAVRTISCGRAAQRGRRPTNYSEGRFAAAWSAVFGLGIERADSCGSTDLELIALGLAGLVAGLVTDDWLAAVSVMTLMVCVRLVMTDDGLFVLPIALAFHWTQGNLGVIYYGLTGREVLGDLRQRLSSDGDDRARLLSGAGRGDPAGADRAGRRPTPT